MEMMVQFSFLVMFVTACPIAGLVCLLNNILEIRIDAIKLLDTKRRPVPVRVPGLQIWNQFMELLVKLGIVCNGAILAFTSEMVPMFTFYHLMNEPANSTTTYAEFSLSQIPMAGWLNVSAARHGVSNSTYKPEEFCWYQGLRMPYKPFDLRQDYWQIHAMRVSFFAIYVCLFFLLMWLVNFFIDDTPREVKFRLRRNAYMINKFENHMKAMAEARNESEEATPRRSNKSSSGNGSLLENNNNKETSNLENGSLKVENI